MERIHQSRELTSGKRVIIREAGEADISKVQDLFFLIYQGKYPLEFGMDPKVLQAEIVDHEHYLWLVAEEESSAHALIGAVMFSYDAVNRLGKAAGGVVIPEHRKGGLGSTMLKIGVEYLTETNPVVDVIYGTTRTVSEGPSKMVADVGFHKMGLFPNAVQIENLEHLNLDVYLTPNALATRRRKPYLLAPFYDVYQIARRTLGLERAYLVTEREPLKLSRTKIPLKLSTDEKEAVSRYRMYSEQKRISNSFFPFHMPNWILSTEDGGTEVFIWYGGIGKQASILGYRSDRVNKQDLLDSVAFALQNAGAAYVELLVDAYDYVIQQEAYTARFIPSAYFPAMKLSHDGKRDDYFVLSRTFRLLDFTGAVVTGDNFKFLQAYMRCYHELYIEPVIGPGDLKKRPVRTAGNRIRALRGPHEPQHARV